MTGTMHGSAETPIAIIGMACRVPGADNLEQFWQLIQQGRHALGPVPADRLDRDLYYDPQIGVCGKTYTDLAGLVNYRPIDRQICPLPEEWLATHDVAHLTLCEVAASACRDARYDPLSLPYSNTGVYVGHAAASGLGGRMNYATTVAETAEYLREVGAFASLPPSRADAVIRDVVDRIRRENPHRNADGSPYLGACVAASLISRAFGLDGPYMSFNAACASSLQALAQALRALQTGRVDMAIVGGAFVFSLGHAGPLFAGKVGQRFGIPSFHRRMPTAWWSVKVTSPSC